MYKYSESSLNKLGSIHPELKRLFYRVLLYRDHSIRDGHRTEQWQEAAFASGASKVHWPNSKHNTFPSIAVDVAPYHVPHGRYELHEWYEWTGFVKGIAAELGIKVRNGGDWDHDYNFDDQDFMDLYHWELLEPPPLPSVEVEEEIIPRPDIGE